MSNPSAGDQDPEFVASGLSEANTPVWATVAFLALTPVVLLAIVLSNGLKTLVKAIRP